jgi:hypothetical protein
MAYFPLKRQRPHRKRRLLTFFVVLGKSLPSCYLETIGGYTDPHTKAYNSSSIVACIHCPRDVLRSSYLATKGRIHFTEPLPSNDRRDTNTDTQTDGRDL